MPAGVEPVDWSRTENEAVVSDYLSMLALEIVGQEFNKAEHNRALQVQTGRVRGSIEFKHQNISAVLRDLGHPWIEGYKPRANYQIPLYDVVVERLARDDGLRRMVEADVVQQAATSSVTDFLSRLEKPPTREPSTEGPALAGQTRPRRPVRLVNYLAREASNASLGRAGEEFVLQFERARLIKRGKECLAERIEHVATQDDGAGFDIRSFEESGRDRLIEVKTTAYGKGTPFFVSRNEVAVSHRRSADYKLYRVFKFRRDPHLFTLSGSLAEACELDAIQFSARVA